MAGSVNKVILVGNLGRDPEVRSFPNGGKVCNLRIATSETWRDRNTGERKERTEWHSVAIFNENLGRIAEQYLRKGSTVYIEGQLETRKWQDQSGQDRYSTEVVLRQFRGELTLLGGRGEGGCVMVAAHAQCARGGQLHGPVEHRAGVRAIAHQVAQQRELLCTVRSRMLQASVEGGQVGVDVGQQGDLHGAGNAGEAGDRPRMMNPEAERSLAMGIPPD